MRISSERLPIMKNNLDIETDVPVPEWRGYTMNYQPVKFKPVPTDVEIERCAKVEWLEILSGMWEAIGKPLDEKRLRKYAKELSGIPLGLLDKAVSKAIRNSGDYQVVPTISAVWKAVRHELGNPYDIDEAIERWMETRYQSAVYRFE